MDVYVVFAMFVKPSFYTCVLRSRNFMRYWLNIEENTLQGIKKPTYKPGGHPNK